MIMPHYPRPPRTDRGSRKLIADALRVYRNERRGGYARIGPGHPMYPYLLIAREHGQWMCDAVDHNEDTGCSNPACWKRRA